MADAGPPKKVRKKLPPLGGTEDSTEGDKKPVRKKKKKPVAETVDEEKPKPTEGTPRKKKKPPTPKKDSETPVENGDASTTTKPTPRKRKKKKPVEEQESGEPTSARSAGSQQGEDVAGSKTSLITKEQSTGTPKKKVKKKVKKTPRTTTPTREEDEFLDANFAADLTTIQEDIVMPSTARKEKEGEDEEEEEEGDEVKRHHPYSTESNVLKSQPIQKLFVETDSGFRGQDKARLAKKLAEEEAFKSAIPQHEKQTTIKLALGTQNLLKTLSLFLHGLTAGISVWQITMTYILLNFTYLDFIIHYRDLALPVQCIFYILLTLCTLSACDRFDVGHITRRFVIQSLTMQTGTIAVFIYAAALIVSLSAIQYEDKIHLFGTNVTLWNNTAAIQGEMTTWQNLNTARCALAILGWIVIAIVPNTDRLAEGLKKGEDSILGTNVEQITSSA